MLLWPPYSENKSWINTWILNCYNNAIVRFISLTLCSGEGKTSRAFRWKRRASWIAAVNRHQKQPPRRAVSIVPPLPQSACAMDLDWWRPRVAEVHPQQTRVECLLQRQGPRCCRCCCRELCRRCCRIPGATDRCRAPTNRTLSGYQTTLHSRRTVNTWWNFITS